MSKATNIGKTRFAPFCKKNHIVKLTIPNYMLETEVNVNFTFLMFAIKHAIFKYMYMEICAFSNYITCFQLEVDLYLIAEYKTSTNIQMYI